MKAIGYTAKGGVEVLTEFELLIPDPGPRDLRVAVRAVSVNPVDVKRRRWEDPSESPLPRVLGYDAAGIVEAVGSDVSFFKPGDEVFYAGAMDRPGTNSEFHLVDERIVGRKPTSLSFAEAAALPLTSITAWEMLFDRMKVPYGVLKPCGTLLVLNGAGGVGSMMIQLANRLTGLTKVSSGCESSAQSTLPTIASPLTKHSTRSASAALTISRRSLQRPAVHPVLLGR
jgi:zinc-binding alcohol dehydrogenase family protein